MAPEWNYEIDDLVWAKMKGFPPWPGRVVEPSESLRKIIKKNSKCIFFFGSENYAWIEIGCLKPYFQFKESLTYSGKTPNFKEACKKIEQFIKDENINGDSNSDLRFENLVQENSISPPVNKKMSVGRSLTSSIPSTSKRRPNPKNESSTSASCSSPKSKPKKARLNSTIINSNANTEILTNLGLTNNHTSNPLRKNHSLLDRPEVPLPECSLLDVTTVSKSLISKNISPSEFKFGFIGLGNMGSGIVKNLLNSGHKVMVWNRSPEKTQPFVDAGATVGLTPSDIVHVSDITFSCVTDPQVAKDMVFGNCGVLSELGRGKGFVEMTGIDPETSQDISESVIGSGARYMEVMIQGSKIEAEEGQLVCMAGGDKSLFDDCESALNAIAKSSIYLGEVGSATKMNLILHTIKGVAVAGLAEGMALADRAGISQRDVVDVLKLTSLNCSLLVEKGKAMMENNFQTNQALKHIQKDLNLSLNWSDILEQPCPVTASVNEVFKHAKRLGYSDHDTSAVYVRAKF